ncbi:hypothetical protein RHDE110596_00680 [Prescottella defluvii]|uniref:hypothetical protein n=1 Tax=Prescottella defluvii TaxID=1323361 RepID=UPI0004F273F0|nr:hypothetical protein [Prescottella defluvii]
MAYKGSRTTSTHVWLTPEDEALVGRAVTEAAPDAAWMCSRPGPVGLHPVHLHRAVEEAFACGPVQAFLLLPFGAAPPAGVEAADDVGTTPGPARRAIVQLLRSRLVQEEWGRCRDDDSPGDDTAFQAGRLAVRWSEAEVDPDTARLLREQTAVVWKALRSATRPAMLVGPDGRSARGGRIGPSARSTVTTTGIPLTRGGTERCTLG